MIQIPGAAAEVVLTNFEKRWCSLVDMTTSMHQLGMIADVGAQRDV